MCKFLYIIGNGFDIHHGINSRFSDYRKWLENNYSDLYDTLIEYYQDATLDKWWNDFENHLAEFDVLNYALRIGFENQPDFASENFRECDRYVAQLKAEKNFSMFTEEIRVSLYKWISQLPMPQEPNVKINKDYSYFLTFNYTHTLEDVYHIPSTKILHIHGSLEEEGTIIYGHGTDRDIIQKRVDDYFHKVPSTEHLSEDEYYEIINDYEIEHSTQLAIEATLLGVISMKKNVKELIIKNSSFFQSISGIERVYVYGFSFSSTDLPYLEEIIRQIKTETHWVISYYSQEDKIRVEDFIQRYNIQHSLLINGL